MMVSHQESYSAVGLYNRAGGAPGLVAKHGWVGRALLLVDRVDPPRQIKDLSEITDAHIRAISPRATKGLARSDRVDGRLCIASNSNAAAGR